MGWLYSSLSHLRDFALWNTSMDVFAVDTVYRSIVIIVDMSIVDVMIIKIWSLMLFFLAQVQGILLEMFKYFQSNSFSKRMFF